MNTMKTQSFFSTLLVSFLLAASAQGQTPRTVQTEVGRTMDVSTVSTCGGDEDCDDALDSRCADGSCSTVLLDTWATLHLVAFVKDGQTVGFEVWNQPVSSRSASGESAISAPRNTRATSSSAQRDGHRETIEVESFSWGSSSSVSTLNQSLSAGRTTGSSTVSSAPMSSFTVCGTYSDATTQGLNRDYCWVISPPGTEVTETSLRTYVIPHVFEQKGRSSASEDWTLSACSRLSPCPLRGTLAQATTRVASPRDVATGQATGKRQHEPVSVATTGTDATTSTDARSVDKSSPVLMTSVTLLRAVTLHADYTTTLIATYDLMTPKK
jgi:hypothetical protein